MQVAVYHMTTKAFLSGLDNAGREGAGTAAMMVQKGIEEGAYVYCALLEVHNMNEAYRLTQNDSEEGWTAGPQVYWSATDRSGDKGQRSSMVGDIFLIGEGIHKEAHIVSSFGFTHLPGIARFIADCPTGTAFDDRI
jgi:hypothetical protein